MLCYFSDTVTFPNSLVRTVAPRQFLQAAEIHDNQTRASFHQLFGGLVTEDLKWIQAVLPIRNGGFGLTSAVITAPFTFLASQAYTMFTLPLCFLELKEVITNLLLSNQPAGSIGYNLYNSLSTDKFLPDLVMNHVKLQHRLTENYHKSKVQEFMDHLSISKDRSRFQSLQGQGAGAWLSALPFISVVALSSKKSNLAMLIRLGCKIPQST